MSTLVLLNPSASEGLGISSQIPSSFDQLVILDADARWVANEAEFRWAQGLSNRVFLRHCRLNAELVSALKLICENDSNVTISGPSAQLRNLRLTINPEVIDSVDICPIEGISFGSFGELWPPKVPPHESDLGVLLIHIDNQALTQNCLDSIERTSYPNKKIYVLENSSRNLSALGLFLANPGLVMLFAIARTSYCESFNLLADFAIRVGALYLFVSNNDTRRHSENIFETLISKLDSSISMVSPSIYDFEGSLLRNSSVWHFGVEFNLATEAYVTTAEMWRRVDGFNNSFNIYCEDVDLLMRVKTLGFEGCYAPEVSLEHLQNGATKKKVFLRTYFYIRNVLWLQKNKDASLIRNLLYFGAQETIAMVRWCLSRARHGDLYPAIFGPFFLLLGVTVGFFSAPRRNSADQLSRALRRRNWELKYLVR